MKSRRMFLTVGLVGMWLLAAAVAIAAEAGPADVQLLTEAQRLYDGHKYDAALKRLNQVNHDSLGFWDKGKHDSLLAKTQKAVEAKTVDEKALADGQEALDKQRLATAVESLTAAANSPYLEDDKRDTARGLLQVAEERHRQAEARAKELITQAKTALDGGQTAEARNLVVEVKAMDVKLGLFDRMALSSLEKKLANAGSAVPVAVAAAEPVRAEPPVAPA
ncbi:MAG: hypothetical protein WBE06_04670, partial [Phycisphaerae bacterium]